MTQKSRRESNDFPLTGWNQQQPQLLANKNYIKNFENTFKIKSKKNVHIKSIKRINKIQESPTKKDPDNIFKTNNSLLSLKFNESLLNSEIGGNIVKTNQSALDQTNLDNKHFSLNTKIHKYEGGPQSNKKINGRNFFLKSIVNVIGKEQDFPEIPSPKANKDTSIKSLLGKRKKHEEKQIYNMKRRKSQSNERNHCSLQKIETPQTRRQKMHTIDRDRNRNTSIIEKQEKVLNLESFKLKEKLKNQGQIKWKYMIKRSKRKRQQLEELFKTRNNFASKNNLEEKLVENKMQKILSKINKEKQCATQPTQFNEVEFNDKTLYVPMNYKTNKLAQFLKKK